MGRVLSRVSHLASHFVLHLVPQYDTVLPAILGSEVNAKSPAVLHKIVICKVILKFLLHPFAIWGLYKGPTAYDFVAGLMIDKHQKTQCFQISEFLQFLPSTCNLRTQMNLGCEPGMSRYAILWLGILMHWAQELRSISLGWWTPDAAPEHPSRQSY